MGNLFRKIFTIATSKVKGMEQQNVFSSFEKGPYDEK